MKTIRESPRCQTGPGASARKPRFWRRCTHQHSSHLDDDGSLANRLKYLVYRVNHLIRVRTRHQGRACEVHIRTGGDWPITAPSPSQSSLHPSINNMSETQLKKLKAEKDRLDAEAEAVKELITVSAACQECVFELRSLMPALPCPYLYYVV